MSIDSSREMLLRATRDGYAVGAFNVTNVLQLHAVLEACVERRSPLIIQTSVSPAKAMQPAVVVAAYRALASAAPVPVALHLDHCADRGFCELCAAAGYTSIMIDGSKEAFEANVAVTRAVVEQCHRTGDVSVEGELGTVSGVEDQVRVVENEALLCDPDQAVEFVERTGVDLFAPAIGTAHGIYATTDPRIDYARLEAIARRVNHPSPRVPLVVHGGTGLPETTVRKLVSAGGSKFNVSTALKHVLIDASWEYLVAHRAEYDPGKLDKAVKEATRAAIVGWIDLLGSAGKA
jgi:tagatose 1,6-diphosphate aldolase GatY/KbaY